MIGRTIFAAALFALSPSLLADTPRPNEPIVAAGHDGTCYAKSIPDEISGEKGHTTVLQVGATQDTPGETFPWYAQRIFVLCNVWRHGRNENTVVRIGPWPDGFKANKQDLAIQFYVAGKLVKSYSTLDIAQKPDNVFASVSHYAVFTDFKGFGWHNGELFFVAFGAHGEELAFSASTGELTFREKGK